MSDASDDDLTRASDPSGRERVGTPPFTLPASFGRYRIVKPLGHGGMGAVFLADDTHLQRTVALKVPWISPEDGADAVARFHHEARAAAPLQHPNICTVFDVGEHGGVHYLTMAYVEGRTLADLVKHGPLPQDSAAAVVCQIASALQYAHRQGFVHRDLKPANVMTNGRGLPVVMDFGLARRADLIDVWSRSEGRPLGTPAYMAPEQVRGEVAALGPACDIYSLGLILYELLTGRRAFGPAPLADLCRQILEELPEPPHLCRPDVDPVLSAVCMRAVAKRPEDRYRSMDDLATAITDYLRGRSQQFQFGDGAAVGPTGDGAAQLLGRGAEALFLLGRWDAAYRVLLSAVELPGLDRDTACRQRNRLVHLCKNMDRWDEALEHSDVCLRDITPDSPADLVARVRVNRGSVLYDLGRRNEAADLFGAALRTAEEENLRLELAAAANNLGIFFHYNDRLADAERVLSRGLAAVQGQPVVGAYLETNLGLVRLTRSLAAPDEAPGAEEIFGRVVEHFRRAGHLQGTSYALSNRGICEITRGRHRRAAEDFEETIALAAQLGEKWSAYGAKANRALLHSAADRDFRAARELALVARDEAEKNHDPKGVADASLIAARAALDLAAGDPVTNAHVAESAVRLLEEAVGLFARLGQRLGEAQAQFGLAEALQGVDPDRAAECVERGTALLRETSLAGLPPRLHPLPWHMFLLLELF